MSRLLPRPAAAALLIGIPLVLASGCASIISGTTQSVAIAPVQDGAINGATTCTVSNSKGSWITNGGGSVTVKKARDDLQVRCVDLRTNGIGMQAAPRTTQVSWAVANFFVFDLCTISCLVDFSNGAIYQYPSQVQVAMPPSRPATEMPAAMPSASAVLPPAAPAPMPVTNGGVSF